LSWLATAAAFHGDAEALRNRDRAISYRELAAAARSLEHALAREGFTRGDAIAVLACGAREIALLLHAAQALGCALLPLNARLPDAELRRQLAASGARALVCDAAQAERAEALARALGIARLELAIASSREPQLERGSNWGQARIVVKQQSVPDPDCALLWLFTSGTSGAAKAAELSQRALRASAEGHARSIGLRAGERWLACMPMFHVGGLMVLVRCALAGASAELHDRFDEAEVARALASGRIALVSLVPAMLARLLDAWGERPPPAALRCILLGGAAAPAALLARAHALGFPVAPTYGLTEAASQVATRAPCERREPLGARLRALPGTELRVCDASGAALPAGAEGEICVRGPTLMTRYVAEPEATARALRGGWLHTGDVGRLDDEGGLEVLDRRTDLIISGGENVYPARVESVLLEHAAVLDVGVVGRADERFGARPVAFVVLRPGARANDAELRAHCSGRLARFETPDAFHVVDALPRNSSGKLLRRELRERGASIPRRP
jgi:O-succinylbenzoic acid--CoA ligase